ncbi:MAG TPA: TusE/DsrC/DsvC family sulfur relay protein [Polyangiaceae bacterium]|jgi:tRNA 2-thiouridine synthesizing protein E|nr:MAG: Sulfite reductase, dissimilatory-type subunit gamma [Deltaproteobacteria bacterium ADurb.Bin207]HNZ20843.1 TusE/DsrC/DsvC family sulfur relay protein [Polyangiaceae bacterium]HOD21416.1 TusE/DsrC/DsvC family sulfur relay protein [Polyangiaceae bacterium]HOE47525.1 TusE/DsrC/DsvC family sulfur relay protein [Polyangiaceae bacterium]HOG98713.1 TusE/DsrC/DsvC family sulfur relay protein [Polyangiaceae bacterium]
MMHDSTYKAPSVDHLGFLDHPEDWTEDFARQTAPIVGITQGLTDRHWAVIRYLRSQFEKTGRCPLLYFVCSDNGLSVADLQALFPSGYLRGACRLAGISYRDSILCSPCHGKDDRQCTAKGIDKVYRVDVLGFLVDPDEWDSAFAIHRAREMGIEAGLTQQHWEVLDHLRNVYDETGDVPTVYSVCEELGLSLETLAQLFPSGYHRGAVKLAGLRVH